MPAPDWTDRRDVQGLDYAACAAVQSQMADTMGKRGATWCRVTALPDADNAVTLVWEGWLVRPDDEGPLPT